jgi:hypothetical protein
MRKRHSGDDVSDLMRNDTQASGKRNSMVKQLATIERKIAGILRAIEDGAYTPTLKERLIALEAEEACLEARLAEIGRRAPVRLHPNAPELYRSMIANGDPALLTTDLSFFGLLSAQLPKVAKLPSSNGPQAMAPCRTPARHLQSGEEDQSLGGECRNVSMVRANLRQFA